MQHSIHYGWHFQVNATNRIKQIDPPPLIRKNSGFTFLLWRSEWHQVVILACQQSLLFSIGSTLLGLMFPPNLCVYFISHCSMYNYTNHFLFFFPGYSLVFLGLLLLLLLLLLVADPRVARGNFLLWSRYYLKYFWMYYYLSCIIDV